MTFETVRLLLRPIDMNDAERLFIMDKDPDVMKYIGVPTLTDVSKRWLIFPISKTKNLA